MLSSVLYISCCFYSAIYIHLSMSMSDKWRFFKVSDITYLTGIIVIKQLLLLNIGNCVSYNVSVLAINDIVVMQHLW
jgi:hypothetical protein